MLYLHQCAAFVFAMLYHSASGSECTSMQLCHNGPGNFPVKGSCKSFIQCSQPEAIPFEVECLPGEIFNGSTCVTSDIDECIQSKCFPNVDDVKMNHEASTTASNGSNKHMHLSSHIKNAPKLEYEQNFRMSDKNFASSSLVSYGKIVISIFLIDFVFVVCII